MNDLGNLLQLIYDLLSGWFSAFTDHAVAVLAKLDLIEGDTSSIKNSASDIKSNTDDIKDNTGAIVTPVLSIKTNTDSIKTDTTSIKNNVSTMTNQLGTINTNVGTAKAFTEDVANNTLEIKNKIVTIASDTTQMRSNSNNITSDVSDIKTALNYYLANTPVTEDVEGAVCNIDTDLSDYLQKCKVTIQADLTGYTGVTLIKNGKNLYSMGDKIFTLTADYNFPNLIPEGNYVFSGVFNSTDTDRSNCAIGFIYEDDTTNIKLFSRGVRTSNTFVFTKKVKGVRFYASESYPTSTGDTGTFEDMQLEVGNTATSYEPYKSMTYPVSFGTTITDGAEIDLLEGVIKINSTPVSYQSITPIAVKTYKGVNNIYSDIGTTALTYRETLKHYMDKQEA